MASDRITSTDGIKLPVSSSEVAGPRVLPFSTSPATNTHLPIPPDPVKLILPSCEVHLLSGAPGAGKTGLTAELVSSLLLGKSFMGVWPVPEQVPPFVGIIAADRAWKSHKQWFDLVGLDQFPNYSLVDDIEMSGAKVRREPDRVRLLRSCIKSLTTKYFGSSAQVLPAGSLIVIDPLALFCGGDLNNYNLAYTHLLDISKLCMSQRITIIGTMHAGKQKSDPKLRYTRPQDRILGSAALAGCTGTTMHLSPPSETGRDWAEFAWMPHHAPMGVLRLRKAPNGLPQPWGPDTDQTASSEELGAFLGQRGKAPADSKADWSRGKTLPLDIWIAELIPEAPRYISSAELVALIQTERSVSSRAVYKVLAQMAARKLVYSPGRGTWSRPAPSTAPPAPA